MIRPGFSSLSDSYPNPSADSLPGGPFSTSMSDPAISLLNIRTPSADVTSSVIPFLSRFIDRNRPLFSGCASPFGKGPWPRAPSPSGGSTLITSAPREAISRAQYGADTISPNSTTRMPSSVLSSISALSP